MSLKTKLKTIVAMPVTTALYIMPSKLASGRKNLIYRDLDVWTKWKRRKSGFQGYSYIIGNFPEFRALLYHRAKLLKLCFGFIYKPKATLEINTRNIGCGLLLQHAFATIITAEKIGENCKIYQQVTIGYNHKMQKPVLGNNVEVCCGAKIIGGVTVGNNVIIGANAVVVKDVPDNSVVVGVPGKVVKKLDTIHDVTL